MNSMPIVDPHQHFWTLDPGRYPWLVEEPLVDFVALNPNPTTDYLPENYFADAKDFTVVKSVHVEANPAPGERVAETAWLQQLADRPENKGFPHGIVASADLTADDFVDSVAAHAPYPNLRGLRQILSTVAAPVMREATWRANFARLGEWNLVFDLHIAASQMEDAARLAADYPDVRIALNHAGRPAMRDEDGVRAWRKGMRLLAPCENISVKLSGFAALDPGCTAESLRPFILETIELFGVERCMFASNFPVDRVFRSYRHLWSAFLAVTEPFTEQEKSQLFHDNARAFYRL